ncbi:MAG: phosphoribosylanthranilate isomerase [Sedimentisphaerales bacterium]|nr:phosphoribosylanthranilate isomerase [Sedimentisphaerales bacterium]
MKTKIKICGITNLADAQLAVQLGTELLGFNFYPPSPRYIKPQAAREIIAQLPRHITTVGVFVNAGTEGIKKVLQQCPLDMVQLHGDETNADCQAAAALGVEVIKALRIREPGDIQLTENFQVEAVLLDAFREELYGGTGHFFDWSWISNSTGGKIFLAGGINPDNISAALAVGTFGVDLCSGVEKSPGVKDHAKMEKLFAEIAKKA